MLNPRTGKKELISQLWHIQADQREKLETDEVPPGDIVGVIGPKDVVTGDTLCEQRHPILLESITFPETVISMAVEPDSSADRKKLEDALVRLGKQDPTFKAKVSDETGQTIISGMGELHLEIIRERLVRDYNLNVKVHKPRVSYRETVRAAATGEGEFQRTTQGESQFARLRVRIEPFRGEQPILVIWGLKPGEVPEDFVRIGREAVMEAAQAGGVVGYPLMHVKFTVAGVDYRDGGGAPRGGVARSARCTRQGGAGAAGADHETRGGHTGRVRRQYPGGPQHPASADHRQRAPRGPDGAAMRSPAGQDVRILNAHPQPVAGTGVLFNGAAQVRPGAAERAGGDDGVKGFLILDCRFWIARWRPGERAISWSR
jgi:hypothetical protein